MSNLIPIKSSIQFKIKTKGGYWLGLSDVTAYDFKSEVMAREIARTHNGKVFIFSSFYNTIEELKDE